MHLRTERGLAYLMTAPGDLGLARAYTSLDLDLTGVHPGDPYDALVLLKDHTKFRVPTPARGRAPSCAASACRTCARRPRRRRSTCRAGVAPSRACATRWCATPRSSPTTTTSPTGSTSWCSGPSMAYTCALYDPPTATLEEAQAAKFDLVARKLALQPGQRLLDVGCGWGTMVRHAAREYGVRALGVTLSAEQAQWAQAAIEREGLGHLAEVRHLDYRAVTETGFDAVSSIGLTEHIGVRNYPAYFAHLRDRLRPGGRLLNHCITRPHNGRQETGAFIDRYVFPDGELIGSGTIIAAAQDQGLEVQHSENLRLHYASTLRDWNRNLVEHWDECVAEVGEGTARVWGLYLAGSRVGFERDEVELHQVLATRNHDDGRSGFPMRPDW